MEIDAAMAINRAELDSKVSILVARKALDVQQQQGDAMVGLIKAAAETGQSGGNGQNGLDLYA